MLLSLETSTDICSIAFQDKSGEIYEKRMQRKGSHSEYVFLFIRELMEEHDFKVGDLEAVLVSNGPGSYTGLRIAASAVKGLLFGTEVKVYAGNTLAGFAYDVAKSGSHKRTLVTGEIELATRNPEPETQKTIHAVINARRKHLYHQQFLFDGELKAQTKSDIIELSEVEQQLESGHFLVGTGINRLTEESREKVQEFGMDHISAKPFIELFNTEGGKEFFRKTTAEELESNYISSSQVNNSKV
ncbi:tRNA (adenosine(37)-N6)-threonylcarbamoyltransferase complex dimerization subunit type 1 TsaB [Gracilimonas mengyeensis]|uniref:tRNA threonylcarbamoyl adenosine modification protein YeaZ n=1 Tax=Gracilimonas mengyeensis TaxID=1302730 RepID=A0A521BDL4_9BACT|nr:tRNA (adenosine(37)-N6)-threonylcarbamoyltransferase complex dimerization subunit type 1 TsaB [Gracilimonas mengyeensis]SMO44830.1 tRNA threonylcarbamoyl adenosine modification protein YeaZ [Gracilimonas mengyeensis]